MSSSPVLYFDLASPYAYLAVARAESVLGSAVELEPVLLGAIFAWRGHGSWAHTDHRSAGMADVEQRARRYGLPAVVWPPDWPANSLAAGRAATWAKPQGRVAEFSSAVYRRQFAGGEDIADVAVLEAAAAEAGLDAAELLEAIRRQDVKDALRQATEEAWRRDVRGVPSLAIGQTIFYGDDRLEEAAAFVASS